MEALGIGEIFLLYFSLLILTLKLFSSWMIGLALWFGAIGVGIWRIQRRHSHWKKLGVPGPTASLLFENEGEIFTKGFHVIDEEWTSEYGETYGSYMSKKADLCSSNLDIIRQALIKKFHCFSDRLQVFGAGTEKDSEDDLLGHTLLSMPGPKWKSVRAQIVPVFTSAQIKQMVPIFDESSRLTVELIRERLDGNGRAKVELKDTMSRLTLDMIAKSGFGEDFNVQRDVDSPFVKTAHDYTNFTLTDVLAFMLFPNIMIELQYRLGKVLMKREPNGFFLKHLKDILDKRRAEAIKEGNDGTERDFISLLLRSLQDEEPRPTSSEDADIVQAEVFDRKQSQSLTRMVCQRRRLIVLQEIIAQAFIFLLASYDEASTTLSLMLYHLACFPDIQERVYQEITDVVGNDEAVSAEQVAHLQFIEQVMCETMRIYPPAPRLNRICVEDTALNGIPMRAGDSFSVPVRVVHFNPKFYPEPEKFDPERFSPAAKAARDPLTFLPFGAGPRNCLGQRVAQFQIRTAVAHIIRAFKLELVDDSPKLPIRFTTVGPFRIVDSLNVHFVARN